MRIIVNIIIYNITVKFCHFLISNIMKYPNIHLTKVHQKIEIQEEKLYNIISKKKERIHYETKQYVGYDLSRRAWFPSP